MSLVTAVFLVLYIEPSTGYVRLSPTYIPMESEVACENLKPLIVAHAAAGRDFVVSEPTGILTQGKGDPAPTPQYEDRTVSAPAPRRVLADCEVFTYPSP